MNFFLIHDATSVVKSKPLQSIIYVTGMFRIAVLDS